MHTPQSYCKDGSLTGCTQSRNWSVSGSCHHHHHDPGKMLWERKQVTPWTLKDSAGCQYVRPCQYLPLLSQHSIVTIKSGNALDKYRINVGLLLLSLPSSACSPRAVNAPCKHWTSRSLSINFLVSDCVPFNSAMAHFPGFYQIQWDSLNVKSMQQRNFF
jgi:hypothetical protein